jgi:hypothetical protein
MSMTRSQCDPPRVRVRLTLSRPLHHDNTCVCACLNRCVPAMPLRVDSSLRAIDRFCLLLPCANGRQTIAQSTHNAIDREQENTE